MRRPEAALVPPLNVQGSGSLMGRQASIDARVAAAATNLTLKGKATLPRGAAPLAGSATIGGTMDLAPFAPLLGNESATSPAGCGRTLPSRSAVRA